MSMPPLRALSSIPPTIRQGRGGIGAYRGWCGSARRYASHDGDVDGKRCDRSRYYETGTDAG